MKRSWRERERERETERKRERERERETFTQRVRDSKFYNKCGNIKLRIKNPSIIKQRTDFKS
jgi:hypothetical protein